MKLHLFYRVFLRQMITIQDIFDEIYTQFSEVPPERISFRGPDFMNVPFSPEHLAEDKESYMVVSVESRPYFVIQELEAILDVDSEQQADNYVERFGQKAVFAELRKSYFLDREPL